MYIMNMLLDHKADIGYHMIEGATVLSAKDRMKNQWIGSIEEVVSSNSG